MGSSKPSKSMNVKVVRIVLNSRIVEGKKLVSKLIVEFESMKT